MGILKPDLGTLARLLTKSPEMYRKLKEVFQLSTGQGVFVKKPDGKDLWRLS